MSRRVSWRPNFKSLQRSQTTDARWRARNSYGAGQRLYIETGFKNNLVLPHTKSQQAFRRLKYLLALIDSYLGSE